MALGIVADAVAKLHISPKAGSSVMSGLSVTPQRHSKRVNSLITMMKEVRRHGDMLTPQAIQMLFEVALEPGVTMQTLEKRLSTSHASVSRTLSALSKWHRLGKPGLDMIEKVQDPVESRRQIVFLTNKGREFVEECLGATCPDQGRYELDAPTANSFVSNMHRKALR